MQSRNRLIVAIDRSSREEILRLVGDLHGIADVFKIGPQAFIANGPSIVREITGRGEKVFLDLKIHDIPNTAGKAVAEAAECGASMVTVHASGGEAMLRACALANPLILGVTLLTSIDDRELQRIGFSGTAMDASLKLALLAQKCGLRGVVASPQEIEAIRPMTSVEQQRPPRRSRRAQITLWSVVRSPRPPTRGRPRRRSLIHCVEIAVRRRVKQFFPGPPNRIG